MLARVSNPDRGQGFHENVVGKTGYWGLVPSLRGRRLAPASLSFPFSGFLLNLPPKGGYLAYLISRRPAPKLEKLQGEREPLSKDHAFCSLSLSACDPPQPRQNILGLMSSSGGDLVMLGQRTKDLFSEVYDLGRIAFF